jgi:hypothetical protein
MLNIRFLAIFSGTAPIAMKKAEGLRTRGLRGRAWVYVRKRGVTGVTVVTSQ